MKNIKSILIIVIVILFSKESFGQITKHLIKKAPLSYTDSLMLEFRNTVYDAFYNRSYAMTQTPVHTMLKIDINCSSKITSIKFSDSADSLFIKTWNNSPKKHNDEATLEKYAKAKNYNGLSLIMPFCFEPHPGDNKRARFSYEISESLLKFDGQGFTGTSIILPAMFIRPGYQEF